MEGKEGNGDEKKRNETMKQEGGIENIFTGKHFKGDFHEIARWTGRHLICAMKPKKGNGI